MSATSPPIPDFATDAMVAILGAGRGSRFGGDKLSAPCAGQPLGRWVLDAALAVKSEVVWIGGGAALAWLGDEARFVSNPDAAHGLGTSLALAARLARERRVSRLLVLLADMPLVTPALLDTLLALEAPAACRQRDGRPGVPAAFPHAMLHDLTALSGDRGAAPLLAARPDLTLLDAAAEDLLDVDTPAMLARAEAILRERSPR